MKTALIIIISLLIFSSASAQLKHPVRDEQGRHIVPRGFVINTEDSKGNIYYTPDDYHRMVKMISIKRTNHKSYLSIWINCCLE